MKSYKVFVNHLRTLSKAERALQMCKGGQSTLKHLKIYMFFLQDVLGVLSDLSRQFQEDTSTSPDALEALETVSDWLD